MRIRLYSSGFDGYVLERLERTMAIDQREDDVVGVYSNSIVETEEVVAEEENKTQ